MAQMALWLWYTRYTTNTKTNKMQRYPLMDSWYKGKTAGSETLIQEADPHIKKLAWSSDVG